MCSWKASAQQQRRDLSLVPSKVSPLGLEQMHLFTAEVGENTSSEIWKRGSQSLYQGQQEMEGTFKGFAEEGLLEGLFTE